MPKQDEIITLLEQLWPVHRSITGPGFRQSLDIIENHVPLERMEFRTGEQVHDWTIPQEWSIEEAYIITPQGKRIADLRENNLHVMGYSIPVDCELTLEELKKHIYTLSDHPDAIPYVTSYFKRDWGFCMSHNEMEALQEGLYHAVIKSRLYDGKLIVGEAVLPGETDEEVLFSSYLCHPSMANNELSGPVVMTFLYKALAQMTNRRYTFRFVYSAETIGTIAYLSRRGPHLKEHLKAGYVLTCIGDAGAFTYKSSRRGDTLADRAAKITLRDRGGYREEPFKPMGSDERQYCSPGYDLPVGSLMRTMYATYPEYHTSLDNLDFISAESMEEAVNVLMDIVQAIENNHVWSAVVQQGEPQLSRWNLYPDEKVKKDFAGDFPAMKWLLNLCDGQHDLLDITERSGERMDILIRTADRLAEAGLLMRVEK